MTGPRAHPRRSARRLALAALVAAAPAAVPAPAPAQDAAAPAVVVVAARTIPGRTVLTEADLALAPAAAGPGLAALDQAVGLETRTSLYAGRPIRAQDLAPPALIERNDLVRLGYRKGALSITVEARALDRGALGERVRVMNLDSRLTVIGRVTGPATVEVSR